MLDIRLINRNRFEHAKRLWAIANLVRFATFVVGSGAVFLAKSPVYLPQILFLAIVTAELVQWRSDMIKSQSESVLRKLDLCRSFDIGISLTDRRDIVLSLPKALRNRLSDLEAADDYFTSSAAPGPRKAVENLVESAWYTKQQARMMVGVCCLLAVVIVGIALSALVVTSHEVQSVTTRVNVSRVVTSWLLLIFSLGLFKHGWAYYKLAERSERTYNNGDHLLGRELTEADALKQWYEYQIGRASSPLLPEWLWDLKQDDLNDAWRRTSSGKPGPA
jgi:hypothetical protein